MTKDNQGRLVGVAVAGVVLCPAVVTRFASPPALVLQAATITAIILALLGVSVAAKGWRRILTMDRLTLLALVLYSAAAVQGAAVALARGNNTALIAGQFLSMILLPLGAAAALGLLRQGGWRPFATGLVAAVGTGGLVQLIMTVPTAINGPPGFRLMLPNSGSFAGVAPLALFLAGALARGGGRRARALLWAVGAVMLAIILGTGIRSQWLVLPAGIAAYAVLAAGRARLLSRRTLVIAGPVIFVLGAGVAATTWWWFKSRPSLLPAAPASGVARAGEPIVFALPGPSPGSGPRRGHADLPSSGLRVPLRPRRTGVVSPRPDASIRGHGRGGFGIPDGRGAAAGRKEAHPAAHRPAEPRLHGIPTQGGGALAPGPCDARGSRRGTAAPASGPGRRIGAGGVRPGRQHRLPAARDPRDRERDPARRVARLGAGPRPRREVRDRHPWVRQSRPGAALQ